MKGLSQHNLRDHMSEAELIFTALAELSTRQIAETDEATGMAENKNCRHLGRHNRQASTLCAGSKNWQIGRDGGEFFAVG